MNFEKPTNLKNRKLETIKHPEGKVKDGVNFIFEQNPELAKIGTKEQYSEYLDNIFPDSKIKEILYHGTKSTEDKKDILDTGFDFGKIENTLRGEGLSIATTIEFTKGFGEHTIPILVNVDTWESGYKITTENLKDKDFDLITDYSYGLIKAGVVTNPDKIQILGSRQDLEGFTKFILENKKLSRFKKLLRNFSSYGSSTWK